MNNATNLRLSVLDLSPVPSGTSSAQALQNTLDLARHCDTLGYHRYWMSEHHNLGLLASASPEIMIGHVANVTTRMRVGSGGIMLPNHAPLKVAENFRLLEALHPGRIDLGIGRAPGTDMNTARALRGARHAVGVDDFPDQLTDLLAFLGDTYPTEDARRAIRAIPLGVAPPPVWLLGSSAFSAQWAAAWGLGFAFAHHINPYPAVESLRFYLNNFRPSAHNTAPQAMVGVSVVCADTDAEAEALACSVDANLLSFQQGHPPDAVPSVQEAQARQYTAEERAIISANRARVFVGSPATVHGKLQGLVKETGAGEVMVTTVIHDHAARRRSYELLATAFGINQR